METRVLHVHAIHGCARYVDMPISWSETRNRSIFFRDFHVASVQGKSGKVEVSTTNVQSISITGFHCGPFPQGWRRLCHQLMFQATALSIFMFSNFYRQRFLLHFSGTHPYSTLGGFLSCFEHLSIADPKTAEMVSTQKILEQRCSTLPISR